MNWKNSVKILVAVGALNLGLDKFLSFNLVDKLGTFATIAYAVVAISGGYLLYEMLFKKQY